MIERLLLTSVLCIAVPTAALAQNTAAPDTASDTASVDTPRAIVLDVERPSNTDILIMRNGDKLTGTILNERFRIRTSYAELEFHNRVIAGIDLEGGENNIEAIITVNNNRFSGFVLDQSFVFRHHAGEQVTIRREKVQKAIFRVRETERQGIPQRQYVILKNGDYFSGRIVNPRLAIDAGYTKIGLNLENVETIKMVGSGNPLTTVALRNGDQLQGNIDAEDLDVELDVGPPVRIYQDRIDIVYCREGFIPPRSGYRTTVPTAQIGQTVAMEILPGHQAEVRFVAKEGTRYIIGVVDMPATDFKLNMDLRDDLGNSIKRTTSGDEQRGDRYYFRRDYRESLNFGSFDWTAPRDGVYRVIFTEIDNRAGRFIFRVR